MPKVSELPPLQYLRVGLIAPSGAGKTWLAGTFPRPAFIDTDRGVRTLINPAFRAAYPGVDPIYEQFDDERDPKTGLFKSATGFWNVIEQVNKWADDPEIETIVQDSATSFSELCLHVGLELNNQGAKPKSYTLRTAQSKDHAKGGGALMPVIQDYGAEMNLFEQFMDQFVGLPKNIVVICHEREDKDKDSGAITRIDPLLTGAKLRAKFGKWFDEVWGLEIIGSASNRRRRLLTSSTNIRTSLKSRLGLPSEIDDPDYGKIAQLVQKAQASIPTPS